jgi:hypothetical protein
VTPIKEEEEEGQNNYITICPNTLVAVLKNNTQKL